MLNRPEEYRRMAEAESRLWWYRALHHLVAQALVKHGCGPAARIVDSGCGTGGLLHFLRGRGYTNCSGFDLSPEAVAIGRQRGLPVHAGDLRQPHAPGLSEPNDAVVSNDTLYFLTRQEQENFLQRAAHSLAPGGLLILNVPALRAFRGTHDLSVGIDRRFTRADLRTLLATTELDVVQLRFWPFLLSPLIYVRRLAQRIRRRISGPALIRSDLDLPPAFLNELFTAMTRAENAFLPWKPIGSSLFVVAKKSLSAVRQDL